MAGILSKLFGGNKSEKDVKQITPYVGMINEFFTQYKSLTNDELRAKTTEFKNRIAEHVSDTALAIEAKNQEAEQLSTLDIAGRDLVYQEVDKMKKDRDKEIEKIL